MEFWLGVQITDEEWTGRDCCSTFDKATYFETKLVITFGNSLTGGMPDLCNALTREDTMGGRGLTVGDGLLELSSSSTTDRGEPCVRCHLAHALFLTLRLMHQYTQPGRV